MWNFVTLRMEGTCGKTTGQALKRGLIKTNPWHLELIREQNQALEQAIDPW